VTQILVAVHPETARDPDLAAQHRLQLRVLRSQEARQYGQALAPETGLILGQDAGAAEGHPRSLHQIVEIAQPIAEQQFVDIANEPVVVQVGALPDGRMIGQAGLAAIQHQGIVSEPGAQIGAALRAFERDGNVGLALREADEPRYGQDIQRHGRMPALEVDHQRCQNDAAKTFGGTDAHMARQALRRTAERFLGGQQGTFDGLGIGQQALAIFGQGKAAGA